MSYWTLGTNRKNGMYVNVKKTGKEFPIKLSVSKGVISGHTVIWTSKVRKIRTWYAMKILGLEDLKFGPEEKADS